MGICGNLCHSLNFVNLLQNFVISFFTLIYMFPWMNNFVFTENNFPPCLIKQESYRSPYGIFQSVYALHTCSIKILRRIVVKVLIMLFIKQ